MAGDTIEMMYIAGEKYLVDYDYIEKAKSISCFTVLFFTIFVLAFTGLFIWLAVDKYESEYTLA